MALYAQQIAQQYVQSGLAAVTAPAQSLSEHPAGMPMPGKVKTWLDDKGFGFITPDNGGPDVFVHRNQLSDGQSLVSGAAVVFECRLNPARGKYEATSCSGAVQPGVQLMAGGGFGCGGKGDFGGKGGKGGSQDNLFIAGLPLDTTEEVIKEVFGQYGIVQQCKMLPDTPGKTDKAALVRFADENQAKWMVENLNGKALPGMVMPLTVRFAGDRGCSYGKAMGKGPPMADNRFAPYGAAGSAVAQAAAANPQLSDATLAAALIQLLPGLNQQNSQSLQALQGVQGLGGLSGLGAADAGAAGAADLQGQAFGADAFGGQEPAAASSAGLAAADAGAPASEMGLGQLLSTATWGTSPGVADSGMTTLSSGTAAAGAAAAATTPGGTGDGGQWLEATDPSSGRPYYYHSVTRDVRWDKPAEMGS